jgi:hypothetical protein
MHKEPKVGSKKYFEHEAKESDSTECKEREESPKHEEAEKKEMGKAAHLKHSQVEAKQHQLTNDLANHLHHPQIGAKGSNLPFKAPKC